MRTAFFISNRTAITAETMAHSLLAQFPDTRFREITVPYVDTPEKAQALMDQIRQVAQEDGERPIVISTLVEPALRNELTHCDSALVLDLFSAFLRPLEDELHQKPRHIAGLSHRISDAGHYESRIDAVNFSLMHDDGGYTGHYDESDIILVGVSRSGKTPASLYLALQFGIRAANYPLTEDDLNRGRLPDLLQPHRNKLYGLTTDPERLHQIRAQRRPNSRYASLEQCRFEVRTAEGLLRSHGIPVLNTTNRSVEEIATTIVQERGLRRQTLG